jgi:cell division protein FtsX
MSRSVRAVAVAGLVIVLTAGLVVALRLSRTPQQVNPSLTAFVVPGASSEQIAAVKHILTTDPDVRRFDFASSTAVYSEVARELKAQPSVAHALRREDAPGRFRIEALPPAVKRLRSRLLNASGVTQVVLPEETISAQ